MVPFNLARFSSIGVPLHIRRCGGTFYRQEKAGNLFFKLFLPLFSQHGIYQLLDFRFLAIKYP